MGLDPRFRFDIIQCASKPERGRGGNRGRILGFTCGFSTGSIEGVAMKKSANKLTPALIGGAVIGTLSSIPIVNMGNCLCCMWVLLGGVIGVYAYRRELPPRSGMTSGEGAFLGLLCGVFGALIGTLFNTFFMTVFGANMSSFLEQLQGRMEEMPPEWLDWMEKMAGSPLLVLIGLFFTMIVYSIFGMLGGIFGVALFGKKKSRR
jgi:uncharacterized membrane protein YeaQ/YmgE (transglycosylase-associated protein family)